MDNIQIEAALNKVLSANDWKSAEQIVADFEEVYDGDIFEVAFRIAVRQACYNYVSAHYNDVELNDIDGCWSSYLHEGEDESIIDFLTSVGAYRDWDEFIDFTFAVETVNNSVLAFDEDFHEEVVDKVLSVIGLSRAEVAEKLDDGSADNYFVTDKLPPIDVETLQELCDLLLITSEDGEFVLDEYAGNECGWQIRELIESLGWDCVFEGERWKFETNGVYYIK